MANMLKPLPGCPSLSARGGVAAGPAEDLDWAGNEEGGRAGARGERVGTVEMPRPPAKVPPLPRPPRPPQLQTLLPTLQQVRRGGTTR